MAKWQSNRVWPALALLAFMPSFGSGATDEKTVG